MRNFFQVYYYRFLLGAVACAVAVSAGWFVLTQNEYRQIRALPVALHLKGSTYISEAPPQAPAQREPWLTPASQSAGAGWGYELFSPPTVCRDKSSGLLSVISPAVESLGKSEPFVMELLEVAREPYRLQLTGYVGEDGAYLAILTGLDRPGGVLAKSGDRLADVGVTVQSVSVREVASESAFASETREIAAVVELFDEKSSSVVMLDSRWRKLSDTFFARVRLGTLAHGAEREVREGDTISDNKSSYVIQRIRSAPAEVVVSRVLFGTKSTETFVLRAAEVRPAIGQSDESKSISSRPATGLFTNAH